MKLTSTEANKLLKKLTEDHTAIIENENMTCVFKAAMGEDPETLRPEYSFEKTQAELKFIEAKIRKIKHAINIFNSTTIIPEFNMTIDEMLIYMPQLTNRKMKLSMLKSRLPKMRDNNIRNTNIIDYTYANYDIKTVTEIYNDISEELNKAQIALDKINNTVEIEINI